MKTKATITVKNKMYPYTLEKTSTNTVHLVSKDARIDQGFLAEDVSEIIMDLPSLIIAEQEYSKRQSDTIRFRVSASDRKKIEKKAMANGFDSVSGYLRFKALS